MKFKTLIAALLASATLGAVAAQAADLAMVSGDTGNGLAFLRSQLDKFEAATGNKVTIVPMPSSTTDQFGQYKLWLAAGNADIDVYQTDVIWAPQLADQFLDLTDAAKDIVKDHFPSIIESQTANGKLVAIPAFTDAPALFYRKDLLEKYGEKVPTTWAEMAATAKKIQDGERAAGNADMQGFVFQGNAYEGLTCDALEWVKSYGGGQIIEADGSISINNPQAAAALENAKSWVGTISPGGVLSYQEEESRGVWQLGNSVFMRNWPYAYALGNGDDSAVKGKFDVAPLPAGDGADARSAATLGGWNVAVSKYSKNPDEAIKLALYLGSTEVQKERAINQSNLPTIVSLYDDADVLKASPFMANWKAIFQNAVPRPSAPAKVKYNEVSSLFWSAVHETLSGNGTAAENLELLEAKLTELKGDAW
jgi:trehalose/maltose transport system substrate-binding protein